MNKKRILGLLATVLLVVLISALIFNKNYDKEEKEIPSKEPILEITTKTREDFLREEFNEKFCELTTNEGLSRKEWYLQYKQLMKEYEGIIELPITIYDQYTDEELDLLFRVVQAEVGDEYGFDEKCNVCSVIMNRVFDSRFPNILSDVLTANQFSPIKSGRIYDVTVSEKTIAACEYAYLFGDTTGGALYFETLKSNVHSAYAEYIFSDSAHKFYK